MEDLNLQQRLFARPVKRIGDVLFSLVALVITSPLFILLALLVKLSSAGPVFYIQERVGRNYSRFGCIKFRTMFAESDDLLSNLLDKSPELKKEFERDFKLREDPRITPIGKFLRRSSLDELPQLLNILRGQMSLVGPRPIVADEIPRYGDSMNKVLSVRPGLTGLWQVSGRNNLSYQRRVRLDLIYSTHRTILLDIRVIIRTFGVLLLPRDRGAY
ncbi:sugar transferase [Prochlorococcus sp. MIT 1307]|uniref:sugar transferase n=1 Tax=Prochlorococcus sp. MIT 1307 TaxID=3096219 RepID=UPI002A766858|nr:sugar transferase [Prochlorococcus sp. MIT 1307]